MQILQISIVFLLGFSLLNSLKCTDTNTGKVEDCPTQVCSYDNPMTQLVRFPFLIRNESLPNSCGYPGFDLFCDGEDSLLINLPDAGVLSVQAIDYAKQEIRLNDPKSCLPRRLLSLNVSKFENSPFLPVQHIQQVYWLYNCSIEFFKSNDNMKPIGCLSGPTYGVGASSSDITSNITSNKCVNLGTIQVPIDSMARSPNLNGDILLSWVEPSGCRNCYQRGGRCGFKSYKSLEVGCYDLPRRGLSKEAVLAIALALAAPLALLSCCVTYFLFRAICFRTTRHNARVALAIALTPQPPILTSNGLDRSVIESYPKVVIGESRRLPKPDEKSCPVCLGEYLPKETLRTLPECSHCFHAECIDEWLLLNASCPVCRNTPSNTPLNGTQN